MALVPGVIICLVGLLAWGLPFQHLNASIQPLAEVVRMQTLDAIAEEIVQTWDEMYNTIMRRHMHFRFVRQPIDAFDESLRLGHEHWPILKYQSLISGMAVMTLHQGCLQVSALNRDPAGTVMVRQNCTHRVQELWDEDRHQLTGVVLDYLPLTTLQTMRSPYIAQTTRAQPFTWAPIRNAGNGLGSFFSAIIGLHEPKNGAVRGWAAANVAVSFLQEFILAEVEAEPATRGGRFALYDEDGLVITATHGDFDPRTAKTSITDLGDQDIATAAAVLRDRTGAWCADFQTSVDLHEEYFLDAKLIIDAHPSVYPLKVCALLLAPRANTMRDVYYARTFAIVFVTTITTLVSVSALLLGLSISQPLYSLSVGMRHLKNYRFADARRAYRRISLFRELYRAELSFASLVNALHAFERYVPWTVVQGLLAGTVKPALGMVERDVVVSFMDMENFTAICECVPPDLIVEFVRQVFDVCCEIIHQAEGTIDRFIGDCIMASWGGLVCPPNPSANALKALRDILAYTTSSPSMQLQGNQIGFRIGVDAGRCLVGNFGASKRWEYAAVGEVVTTAARLEPFNKQLGTKCLVSDTVREKLKGDEDPPIHLRRMGHVQILGSKKVIRVHELLTDSPDTADWDAALQFYEDGNFRRCSDLLRGMVQDKAAAALLQELRSGKAVKGDTCFIRVMRVK